jgi:hypothetical protein
VKGLGLEQRHFGEPVPLFKRLGGRFFPKNSSFQRPVEKVGLEQGEAFELRALRGLGIEIKLARVPKRRIKKTADRNLSKDPMTRRQVRLVGRNWNDLSR